MASLELAFDILARDRASSELNKIGDSADRVGGKLSKFGGVAKAAIGGAAIGAVAGLGAAMVGGMKDAIAYETLQNKTAAVLKSTGNVANTSVEGIQNLAAELETLSGVDEELIINGQNVLATFTKVRNETGKGNKIFDRATKSALDMSVALGTDMQSATVMLGKALNDPIGGITAMTRAGVQFTDQQKEQIRTLIESGDTLGAQKVILGELETQFGGTAEAAGQGLAGDMARVKDAFSDTFREIATKALPVLADFMQGVQGLIVLFKEQGLSGVMRHLKDRIVEAWPSIRTALGNLAQGLWNWVVETAPIVGEKLLDMGRAFVEWVGPQVPPLLQELAELVGKIGVWILEKGFPALVLHAQHFAKALVDWIKEDAIPGIIAALPDIIRTVWEWIKDAVPRFIRFGKRLGEAVVKGFREALKNLFIGGSEQDIVDAIEGLPPDVRGRLPDDLTVGHAGGHVTTAGIVPFRSDEVLAKLQVGETVIPKGGMPGGFDAVGEDQLVELRRQNGLLARIEMALHSSDGSHLRALGAVMA